MAMLVTDRNRYVERVTADRARRVAREWKLNRAFSTYAGTYKNDAFGEIEVSATAEGLDLALGVMHFAEEPGADVNIIRVELVSGSRELISFLDTPQPEFDYGGATHKHG